MSEIENAEKQIRLSIGLDVPGEKRGLTEIRVHGVGGTSPDYLLGDTSAKRVAGDRIAGFYRTSDENGRHREAYSWGGLTSHSPLRATMWILMVPQMLANLAGWMARPAIGADLGNEKAVPTTTWFRCCARFAALGLTVSTSVVVTMLSLDIFAYQCLWQQQCRSRLWGGLNDIMPVDEPGKRLAIGAVVPVILIFIVFVASVVSRSRYENVEPPTPGPTDPIPEHLSAAAQEGGLRNPGFWSGRLWHAHLSNLHLTAAVAVLAAVLGWCVYTLGNDKGFPESGSVVVAHFVSVTAIGIVLIVIAWLCWDIACPRGTLVLLTISISTLLIAAATAWTLPPVSSDPGTEWPWIEGSWLAANLHGMLPGTESSLFWAYQCTLLLIAPLVFQQAWVGWRRIRAQKTPLAQRANGVSRAREAASNPQKVFPFAAPVVMNVVALIIANAALLSLVVATAGTLGELKYGTLYMSGSQIEAAATWPVEEAPLWVPEALVSALALQIMGIIGALIVAVLVICIFTVLGRKCDVDEYKKEYEWVRSSNAAEIRNEGWLQSAFDPAPFSRTRPSGSAGGGPSSANRPSKWVRKAARMRFFASRTPYLGATLLIGIAVVVCLCLAIGLGFSSCGYSPQGFASFCGWSPPKDVVKAVALLSLLLPVAYGALIRAMFRNESMRKALMIPFDVGTFFPRSFHPFAPPAYTERAVPELTRRIWLLHDTQGRVVLTAHSQGSVLAAAVLARLNTSPDDKPVGLVTLGSPLAKLYRWAFPALISEELLLNLAHRDGKAGEVYWRNVYYETDYIGGPVAANSSTTVHATIDRRLVDPETHWFVFGQPLPRIRSHTGYWEDKRFWCEVDEMCTRIGQVRWPATLSRGRNSANSPLVERHGNSRRSTE